MTTIPTRIPKRLKEAMNQDMDLIEKELGLSMTSKSYGESLAKELEKGLYRQSVFDKAISGKNKTDKKIRRDLFG